MGIQNKRVSSFLSTWHCLVMLFGAVMLLTNLPFALAQQAEESTPQAAPEDEEKVQTGLIAGFGNFGNSGGGVDVETGSSVPGDSANIIKASISNSGRDKCTATVTNSSEESTYTVRFRVVGKSERGATVVNRSFAATLSPKESTSRTVTCRGNSNRMGVVLKSATKKGS